MGRRGKRRATGRATDRGIIWTPPSWEERKAGRIAASHRRRRVRKLPAPSPQELEEIVRSTKVAVKRYAPGPHLGWRPHWF